MRHDTFYAGRVKDAAPCGGGYEKAAARHPLTGWGRRPYGFAVGVAPSADGAWNDGEFRAVRGVGVSLAAASDRGFAPGPQNFFEKKFSKSF